MTLTQDEIVALNNQTFLKPNDVINLCNSLEHLNSDSHDQSKLIVVLLSTLKDLLKPSPPYTFWVKRDKHTTILDSTEYHYNADKNTYIYMGETGVKAFYTTITLPWEFANPSSARTILDQIYELNGIPPLSGAAHLHECTGNVRDYTTLSIVFASPEKFSNKMINHAPLVLSGEHLPHGDVINLTFPGSLWSNRS